MDRLTEIASLLDSPDDLTDEQIAELEQELRDLFAAVRAGEVDGVDPSDITTLQRIVELVEQVRALAAERERAAQELAERIAELEAQLAEQDPADDAEDGDDAEQNVDMEPVAEAESDAEQTAEPVAASADSPTLGQIVSRQPAVTRPRPTEQRRDPRVRLASDTGRPLTSMRDAVEHIAHRWHELGDNAGKRTLVHLRADYPEQRILGQDATENARRVAAVVDAEMSAPGAWSDAVVASGGWCAASPVDYGMVLEAEIDRPVRDGLPPFRAERGGVRLPVSPTLADIDTTGPDAAVAQHTAEEDVLSATKPIQDVDCPLFAEFAMYAVTKRLRFPNMGARAFPENVEQWTALSTAAHARLAESLLLDAIKAESTQITESQTFGAARDILETIVRVAAFRRSSERMNPEARFRVALPAWIIDLMRADLIRTGDARDGLLRARSEIIEQLAAANVTPTFTLDSPSTGPSQVLSKQLDGSPVRPWPCSIQWGMWAEGQVLFLDGGSLDLGVVRDSELDTINRFEMFAETFEGIAVRRGPEMLWVTQNVVADGSHAAGVDGAVTCGS